MFNFGLRCSYPLAFFLISFARVNSQKYQFLIHVNSLNTHSASNGNKSNTGLTVKTLPCGVRNPPDFIRFVKRLTCHVIDDEGCPSVPCPTHVTGKNIVPLFLLSDGCFTLLLIGSRTPLSNQRSSLSKITTFSELRLWHVVLMCV